MRNRNKKSQCGQVSKSKSVKPESLSINQFPKVLVENRGVEQKQQQKANKKIKIDKLIAHVAACKDRPTAGTRIGKLPARKNKRK